MTKKRCNTCGCEWDATTEYYYRSTKTEDGLRPTCIICTCEKQQIHYLNNLETERRRKRDAYWQGKVIAG